MNVRTAAHYKKDTNTQKYILDKDNRKLSHRKNKLLPRRNIK